MIDNILNRWHSYLHLEQFLTRTAWWVIPLIWLPVVCWSVFTSAKIGLSPYQLAATVIGGIFMWTFMEYSLHRFLFHIKTKSYWFVLSHHQTSGFLFSSFWWLIISHRVLRVKLHAGRTRFTTSFMAAITSTLWMASDSFSLLPQLWFCLCQYVQSSFDYVLRSLFFFFAHTLLLWCQFWNLIKLLAPASYAPAVFGGGLLGYVMYDCTHYYLHHGKPLKGVSHDLKV